MGRVIAKSNIYPAIRHKLIKKVILYLYHNELASVHTWHNPGLYLKELREGWIVVKTVPTCCVLFVGNKMSLYFSSDIGLNMNVQCHVM